MITHLKQQLPNIEKNLGFYIVHSTVSWVKRELQYKGHHLSFDEVKAIQTAFSPLFDQDKEAVYCFAHLRSTQQVDPKTDIILPEYSKAPLLLPKIDRHVAAEMIRALATVERYLTHGLGFKHGKLNRAGNYSEAVAGGLLTWCRHRLPYWVVKGLQSSEMIHSIFSALLQSLSNVQAQPSAKEKYDILEDLKLTIKNDLSPSMFRLVSNLSAAQQFEAMQQDADQIGMDMRRLVVALSDQHYTDKQPKLCFITDRALSEGFVCEQAGRQAIHGLGAYLVPKVALNRNDPLAAAIQKSAMLALKGEIDTLTPNAYPIDLKDRSKLLKNLHPACRQTIVKQSGSKQPKRCELDNVQLEQSIEQLQALLMNASRLSALAVLLRHLACFSKFVGSQAMFNPEALTYTFTALQTLLDSEHRAWLENPLVNRVERLMDCGCFIKTYAHHLNYGQGEAIPNLKQLIQSLHTRFKSLVNHWQKIHVKRTHFTEAISNARRDQVVILKGLQHLLHASVSGRQIAIELEQVMPNLTLKPLLFSGTHREMAASQLKPLHEALTQLVEIGGLKQLDFKAYQKFLHETFSNTAVKWSCSTRIFHQPSLTYTLTDDSIEAFAKLAKQVDETLVRILTQENRRRLSGQKDWEAVSLEITPNFGLNREANLILDEILMLEPIDSKLKDKLISLCYEMIRLREDICYQAGVEPILYRNFLMVLFRDLPIQGVDDVPRVWKIKINKHYPVQRWLSTVQYNIMWLRWSDFQNSLITGNPVLEERVKQCCQVVVGAANVLSGGYRCANWRVEKGYNPIKGQRYIEAKQHQLLQAQHQKNAEGERRLRDEIQSIKIKMVGIRKRNREQLDTISRYEASARHLEDKYQRLIGVLKHTLSESLAVIKAIIHHCESNLFSITGLEQDGNGFKTIDRQKIKSILDLNDKNAKWAFIGAEYGSNLAYQSILENSIQQLKGTIEKSRGIALNLKNVIEEALGCSQLLEVDIQCIREEARHQLDTITQQIKDQNKLLSILHLTVKRLEDENSRLKKIIVKQHHALEKMQDVLENHSTSNLSRKGTMVTQTNNREQYEKYPACGPCEKIGCGLLDYTLLLIPNLIICVLTERTIISHICHYFFCQTVREKAGSKSPKKSVEAPLLEGGSYNGLIYRLSTNHLTSMSDNGDGLEKMASSSKNLKSIGGQYSKRYAHLNLDSAVNPGTKRLG